MKKSKLGLTGSITLETTYVFSLVLFVIFMLIEMCLYVYDITICREILMEYTYGEEMRESDNSDLQLALKNKIQETLFMGQVIEVDIENNNNKVKQIVKLSFDFRLFDIKKEDKIIVTNSFIDTDCLFKWKVIFDALEEFE